MRRNMRAGVRPPGVQLEICTILDAILYSIKLSGLLK